MRIETLLARSKIIPIVTIENPDTAAPLAEALIAGGMNTVGITLRTKAAYEAIRLISDRYKELLVGAGTVTTPKNMKRAIDAGAEFIISPGLTEQLAESSRYCSKPFMPGVTTTSEVMNAMEYGFKYLKFFPAESSGGVNTLKNWHAMFKDTIFTPTGGINANTMQNYLAMENVMSVGGSWIAPLDVVKNHQWYRVREAGIKAMEVLEVRH